MSAQKIPESIGRYRIERKIGQGGMGVVFLAEDTRLRRRVALKLLPDEVSADLELMARFEREARTAAQLHHPNLATIYDLGKSEARCFIAMEYIEGKTLAEILDQSKFLPVADCLEIAVQLAQGMAAAHEQNIIHRDLKPGNVMVTGSGQVKILDFGLAKVIEGCTATTGTVLSPSTGLTKAGEILGTVNYMSPEQARGHPVDARSDLFSFGAVLYEMATGTKPFERPTAVDTLSAILYDAARPASKLKPEIPHKFVGILGRLLAKKPEDRYPSSTALLLDLQQLRQELQSGQVAGLPGGPERGKSIAVLPFVNMSADPENEYFSDGLAEELINVLAHVEGLHVASRTSAFQFKGKALNVRAIGEELNVETVLEGSVRKAGNRVRITAQLIKTADGYHLWSERYDRELEDVFAVQDEIAQTIVDTLKVKVIGAPLVRRYTENTEAYNLYLKGRYFWYKRHLGELHKSIECFRQAIEIDPSYALAYAGMADSYSVLSLYGFVNPREGLQKTRAAALKALEIDDRLAEAHFSRGAVFLWLDLDYQKASGSFQRAITLNPKNADAHCWLAHSLNLMGKRDEAIASIRRAQELDPLSPMINVIAGVEFYLVRRFEEALTQCRKASEMDPNNPAALWVQGATYMGMARYADAIAPFERAAELTDRSSFYLGMLGGALGASGRMEEARRVLDELRIKARKDYVAPLYLAWIYLGLGETEQAGEMLEEAARDYNIFVWSSADPLFDAIRSDPRFRRAIEHGGLRSV